MACPVAALLMWLQDEMQLGTSSMDQLEALAIYKWLDNHKHGGCEHRGEHDIYNDFKPSFGLHKNRELLSSIRS